MDDLTAAQRRTLKKMRGYRVVARLQTGAILVVSPGRSRAVVIDTDGSEFSFRDYLSGLDEETPASDADETPSDDDQDSGSGGFRFVNLRSVAGAISALV
jgi:hypothetical protein